MNFLQFWLYSLVISYTICIIAIDIRPEIDKYCRERERLFRSMELDEYLLIDAEVNTTIVLNCHFCNEENAKGPKIWYRQDHYQDKPAKELELGMDNNMSINRIHTTPDFSLVINHFDDSDGGIYRCHGPNGEEEENKYNYRLEAVHKPSLDVEVFRGNITDWEQYRELNLQPVTNRLAVSRIDELTEIRSAGIILELVSEWTPWSACGHCVRKKGIKTSRAQCRLKRRFNHVRKILSQLKNDSKKHTFLDFFSKVPLTACRAAYLATEVPILSKATRDLPEFILEEKCNNCSRVKKSKKGDFKHKKRYTLAQGAHLAIVCPEATLETIVIWRKDSLQLKKGMGSSFRRKDTEPRVLVDTFSTLYLIDVSIDEEGNYTCYADNVKMMQVQIRVVSKSRLLTQAFLRHMGYLGFIFLLTSFCYCGGVFIACREKDKFKVKNYEEIERD